MQTISISDRDKYRYFVAHRGGEICATWSGPESAAYAFVTSNWSDFEVLPVRSDEFHALQGKHHISRVDDGRLVIGRETYREQRRLAYPPIEEFADAFYWIEQGDNAKMNRYLAAVTAVKQQFPKE